MIDTAFAPIPVWLFREQVVSANAMLVFGSLSSRQGKGGIYPSTKTIAKEAQCSVRTVISALNELEAAGLITRVRRKSSAGRASNGYELHFGGRLKPYEVSAEDAPTTEVSATDDVGKCKIEHPTPYIEGEPLNQINPYSPQTTADLETAFATFWNIYPRRAGKQAALKAFIKAAESAGLEVVLEGARRFRDDPNLPEPKFVPHPATWLNQGRWEDDPLPPRGGNVSAQSAAAGWFALAGEVESRGEISA